MCAKAQSTDGPSQSASIVSVEILSLLMDIVDSDTTHEEVKGINPAAVDGRDASVITPREKKLDPEKVSLRTISV